MCVGSDEGLRNRFPSRFVTRKEMEDHTAKEDSWIAIKGRVYDVSGFGKEHPGGDILYTASGTDGTGVFSAFHPPSAWAMLQRFYVGDLKEELGEKKEVEYAEDVANMRKELQRLHAFDSSKLYYVYKIVSNLLILCLGMTLISLAPSNPFFLFIGAFFVGLFFQQCGWLAHDFCHHQVFKNRIFNNMVGLLVGNIFQGFSVSWWKNKHNHHHAVPNVIETCAGGDPDIHTMPVLLWSEKLIEGEDLEKLPRFLVRNQWLFYFPLLCLARMSWLLQSIEYMFEPEHAFVGGKAMKIAEIVTLAIHHGLVLFGISRLPSIPAMLFTVFFMQAFGGLLIGVVFTVGHNAMEVLTEKQMRETDFVQLQLRTTRNVTPSWFSDFFTGGLNYQVEHHIWPTIPRHNLPIASRVLQEFCHKHNLTYHCKGLVEGNEEVCKFLFKVSSTVE